MITEAALVDALRAGVNRTRDFMARITDYHGGPIETEYLLTGDLAREFLDRGYEVGVERLNRSFCNPLASHNSGRARRELKGKRTDVVVGDRLLPTALIEVKIRISRYSALEADLRKLCDTIDLMDPARKRVILGVSLFQTHIKSTQSRLKREHFESAVIDFEKGMRDELVAHAHRYKNFNLTLVDLLANQFDGIVDQAIEEDSDGTPVLGARGHATRYYAIFIKHDRFGSAGPSNFLEMKAEATGQIR